MEGRTLRSRGGVVSSNTKLRVSVTVLLASSVAVTRAVIEAPVAGALDRETTKVLVMLEFGLMATASVWVVEIPPLRTSCRCKLVLLSDDARTRVSGAL